jgi:hypothetical protein
VKLLVDEARIGCSSGMLLCLPREQRLVYILGEIHRDHPFHTPPDFVAAVRNLINRPDFQSILGSIR